MRLLISILAVMVFAGQGWGAVYYVSPTGSDAADGSVATPWQTFGKARVTAGDGDTVYFADGTYLSTAGAYGEDYFRIDDSVSWQAINAGQVIWKANSTSYVVRFAPSAQKSATIGAIIIDGTGTVQAAACIQNTFVDLFNSTLTLNGTTLRNFTTWGFNGYGVKSYRLVVRNIAISSSITTPDTADVYGISSIANNDGSVDIDGVTFNISGSGDATNDYVFGIYVTANAAFTGIAPIIKNITGTIAYTGNITTVLTTVRNIDNTLIEGINNFTINVPNGAYDQVLASIVNTGNTLTAHNGIIRNCNGNTFYGPNGKLFYIGPQDHTRDAANKTNNGLIENCEATGIDPGRTGNIHGMCMYFNTGGRITRSKFTGGNPGFILEGTDETTIADYNVAIDNYGLQAFYAKYANGSKFYNNTVVMSPGKSGVAFAVRGLAGGSANPSQNVIIKNNVVYIDDANPKFVAVAADNTATFDNNIYYSTNALIAESWNYQLTNYSTFATWQAAGRDTQGWNVNPRFRSTADLRLLPSSPCINKGVNVGLTTDFLGHSLRGTPDIGAYEYYGQNGGGFGMNFGFGW